MGQFSLWLLHFPPVSIISSLFHWSQYYFSQTVKWGKPKKSKPIGKESLYFQHSELHTLLFSFEEAKAAGALALTTHKLLARVCEWVDLHLYSHLSAFLACYKENFLYFALGLWHPRPAFDRSVSQNLVLLAGCWQRIPRFSASPSHMLCVSVFSKHFSFSPFTCPSPTQHNLSNRQHQ